MWAVSRHNVPFVQTSPQENLCVYLNRFLFTWSTFIKWMSTYVVVVQSDGGLCWFQHPAVSQQEAEQTMEQREVLQVNQKKQIYQRVQILLDSHVNTSLQQVIQEILLLLTHQVTFMTHQTSSPSGHVTQHFLHAVFSQKLNLIIDRSVTSRVMMMWWWWCDDGWFK